MVISALGAAGRGPTTLYSDSAAAISTTMRPGGRLLVISSAGVSIPSDAGRLTGLFARLLHRIMREVYTDMNEWNADSRTANWSGLPCDRPA